MGATGKPAGTIAARPFGRSHPWLLAAAAALTALSNPGPLDAAEPIVGAARAADGDTLVIGSTEVGLRGIDAPDVGQTCLSRKRKPFDCGALSRQALQGIVGRDTVTCKNAGSDETGRLTADCFLGWLNIAEQMVADGRAFARPTDNNPYTRAQTFAKARREGLWRGTFDWPWDWRRANRAAGRPQ